MLDPSPSGETADSELQGMLLGQDSEESDDEDADYIPAGLASFVKQAEATLNKTRETFLSTAAKSPPREPAIFCFEGTGRSATPPLEDEEDIGLREEVLGRFKQDCGNFDVNQILSSPNVNGAEEVLFSPDLRTPPANPHFDISSTQARKLALGSPGLTVDTDVLPIRPPTHDDSDSSNSVDEEPDEPMDPMSWLDPALCERSAERGLVGKRPDPPSQPTPQRLEPTGLSQKPAASPFGEVETPMSTPVIVSAQQIEHVGEVDETRANPPPSSPKPVPIPVVRIEAPKPPLENEDRKSSQNRSAEKMPVEVSVTAPAIEQKFPQEVSVPTKDKSKVEGMRKNEGLLRPGTLVVQIRTLHGLPSDKKKIEEFAPFFTPRKPKKS